MPAVRAALTAPFAERSVGLLENKEAISTRVVSADGKTLTITTKGTDAQGQAVNNVQVFERQ